MPHKFARNRLLKLPSSHLRGQEILQEKVECTYKTPRGGRISMWNYQCSWKFYLFCRMYSYVEEYCESACGGVHTFLQRQASRHHNVCHHAQQNTQHIHHGALPNIVARQTMASAANSIISDPTLPTLPTAWSLIDYAVGYKEMHQLSKMDGY